MTDIDWTGSDVRCLGMRLAGDAIEETDPKGRPLAGDTLLVLLNAHHEPLPFTLPAHKRGIRWELLLDTSRPHDGKRITLLKGGAPCELEARSVAVLRLRVSRNSGR